MLPESSLEAQADLVRCLIIHGADSLFFRGIPARTVTGLEEQVTFLCMVAIVHLGSHEERDGCR